MAALLLAPPRPAAAGEVDQPLAEPVTDELGQAAAIDLAEAKAMFNGGDHQGAALAFDALWADEQTPVLLYYAAVAWASCGDDTRAILRWRRYLAADGTESHETARTHEYLREAYKRTIALSLAVDPAGALVEGSSVELVRLPETSQGGAIIASLADGSVDRRGRGVDLFLSPGTWRITVTGLHAGYEDTSVELEAIAETGSLERSIKLLPREGELEISVMSSVSQAPLHLILEDAAELEASHEMTISSGRPTNLRLRRGTWNYRVVDPTAGWESSGDVEIDDDLTRLSIERDDDARPSSREGSGRARGASRRRLSLGLGVSSAAIGAAGLGLIVPTSLMLGEDGPRVASGVPQGLRLLVDQDRCASADSEGVPLQSEVTSREELKTSHAHRQCVVSLSLRLHPVGGALLGASLGLATNAVIVRTNAPQKFLAIPAVAGLVAGAAGGILLLGPHKEILADLQETDDIHADVTVRDETMIAERKLSAAVGLIGLGGGLIVGAGAALLAGRARSSRLSSLSRPIRFAPTLGGGGLSVDF